MNFMPFRKIFFFITLVPIIVLFIGCSGKSGVVGQWREIDAKATLEFRDNGKFYAVDNQGLAVSGNYFFEKDGRVRFEVFYKDLAPETLYGKIVMMGDTMKLVSEDGSEIERYKRVK